MKKLTKVFITGLLVITSLTQVVAADKPTKTNIGGLVSIFDSFENEGNIHYPKGSDENVTKDYRALFVNGYAIDGAEIITREDRTLLPIRMISELLGLKVGWDDATRKVTLENSEIKIEMNIGKKNVKINGVSDIIDVEPIIYHDRTYLPLRFISEKLDAEVGYYDNKNPNTLGIITNIPQVTVDEKYSSDVKVISKEDAIVQIKKALKDSLELQKKNLEPENIKYAEDSIEKISYEYDISRYYVLTGLEGIYNIIFDKYTGDMYKRSYTQIQTIIEFKVDDATNFSLAG